MGFSRPLAARSERRAVPLAVSASGSAPRFCVRTEWLVTVPVAGRRASEYHGFAAANLYLNIDGFEL
jgi:hypothetical protein